MRSLSLADDGGTVDIEIGDTLSVCLPENATSGHIWAPDDLDPDMLELLAEAPDYPGRVVGSGGEVTFQIRAAAPGVAELAFKKWREWEGSGSIVERFRVRVTVRAPGP